MFKLVIGYSSSKNFRKAVDIALDMGGVLEDNKITMTIQEEMKAYQTFFPLFKLNVLSWARTRAYHNGKQVDPYRFMFLMERKRNSFYADVLEQLDPEFDIFEVLTMDSVPEEYLYHKREGNRFFFQGEDKKFSLELTGKRLYEFVDKYNIGDLIYFE